MESYTSSRPDKPISPKQGGKLPGGFELWVVVFLGCIALTLMVVPQTLNLPGKPCTYLGFGLLMAIATWQIERLRLNTVTNARDRSATELKIAQQRDLQEAIFDESADALFLVDPKTLLILDCNRRAVELFEADDKSQLIGIQGHELQQSQFLCGELEAIAEEIRSRGFWSRELEYVTFKGRNFWGNLASKSICVAGQEIILVRVTDITNRKQVEEELKRSHEQLELRVTERTTELQTVNHRLQQLAAIVESSEDAIISKSLDGTILTWNTGAEKLFGYTANEAIGRSIKFLCPPQQGDCISDILAAVRSGKSLDRYEAVRQRKDGSMIHVSVTISPIKDMHGQIIAASAIQRDITHQKQAKIALQQAHDQLAQRSQQLERVNHALTDTLIDLQAVQEELRTHAEALQSSENNLREAQRIAHLGSWEFDLTTQQISWSEEMFQIFGRSLALGAPNYLEMLEAIHPSDRSTLEQLTQHLRIGNPWVQVEYRVIRPDNTIRHIEGRAQLIQDPQGQATKIFGISLDITERKQVEDSLRRYQRVFAATTDGYCLVDRSYTYRLVNPTYGQWHQKSAKQLLGRTVSEVLGTEVFTSEIKAKLDQCFSGEVVEYNLWFTYPYRGRQFIGVTYSPFYEPDGTISGAVVSLRNLSSLKRIELELQQAKEAAEAANQAKSLFLANMSHELRTPLNIILGFAQVMNRDPHLTPEQRKYLLTIHRSGDHLLSLINDVLDLSKLEAGQTPLNVSEFNLLELLHTLRDMFQYRAAERGLQFTLAIAPDVPKAVITDAKKLRQVLINLLANAINFTEHGQVALRVSLASISQEKIVLIFIVEDTGVGIPAEDLDSIFTAFVQSQRAMTIGGTGLGLTISRHFIELMGGKISVRSVLGQGSCFQFTIPIQLAEDIQDPLPNPTLTVQLAPNQPAYRILVVDDQLENQQLILNLMAQLGLEAQSASTGEAAIALWQQWHPDLIWMDLRMPGIDGFEATRQIRATAGPQPVIIALTAYTSSTDHDRALAMGCNSVITKPFREEDLLVALNAYLGLCYVDANDPKSAPLSTSLPVTQLLVAADSTAIASIASVMPSDWIASLRQAALLCNKQQVLHLLDQIPCEHSDLAQHLNNLVSQYQFNEIAELAQPSDDASDEKTAS